MKITEFNTGDIIKMTDEKKVAEWPELFRYALEFNYIENDEIHLILHLHGSPHPVILKDKTHMEGWDRVAAHYAVSEMNIKAQLQKAQDRFFNNVGKLKEKVSELESNYSSGLFPQQFQKGMQGILNVWDSIPSEQLNNEINELLDARIEYEKLNG